MLDHTGVMSSHEPILIAAAAMSWIFFIISSDPRTRFIIYEIHDLPQFQYLYPQDVSGFKHIVLHVSTNRWSKIDLQLPAMLGLF